MAAAAYAAGGRSIWLEAHRCARLHRGHPTNRRPKRDHIEGAIVKPTPRFSTGSASSCGRRDPRHAGDGHLRIPLRHQLSRTARPPHLKQASRGRSCRIARVLDAYSTARRPFDERFGRTREKVRSCGAAWAGDVRLQRQVLRSTSSSSSTIRPHSIIMGGKSAGLEKPPHRRWWYARHAEHRRARRLRDELQAFAIATAADTSAPTYARARPGSPGEVLGRGIRRRRDLGRPTVARYGHGRGKRASLFTSAAALGLERRR